MHSKNRKFWLLTIIAVVVLLYCFPLVFSENITFRLASILITALFATSFNLLLGYTGLVSFGQAAFFAIGAYSIALIMSNFSSFLLGMVGAVVITAFASLILGFISFRAKGIYFAILTLALGQLVYQVLFQSSWSGGQNGIPGIRAPELNLGFTTLNINGMPNFYFVILTVVLISLVILWFIVQSRFGKTLVTIREDETRASFLGVNIKRLQLIAFVISGTFAGVAGALSAPLNTIITADIATWVHSATPIIVSLLGGISYFFGPVVGAFVYEIFNFVTSSIIGSADLFVGILLLIVVMFFPKGILGFSEKFRKKDKSKTPNNLTDKSDETREELSS